MTGVAHQKLIRDKRAAEDADIDLFGRWWERLDLSLGKSVVKEIDFRTAATIIERYEWLGTMGAMLLHAHGIYFDGALGGAVVYRVEYIEHLGKWDKYGYTGKIICLCRGACAHWTPVGTASRLIRRSMDLLPQKYEVITATVDAEAGEVGTIYQACGFYFVGQLSPGTVVSVDRGDGKRIHGKHIRELYGTRSAPKLIAMGVSGVQEHAVKQRYFAFRGPKGAIRKHTKAISNRIKPYPKRAACPLDAPSQGCELGETPRGRSTRFSCCDGVG